VKEAVASSVRSLGSARSRYVVDTTLLPALVTQGCQLEAPVMCVPRG
jgi:hypothetical protein